MTKKSDCSDVLVCVFLVSDGMCFPGFLLIHV